MTRTSRREDGTEPQVDGASAPPSQPRFGDRFVARADFDAIARDPRTMSAITAELLNQAKFRYYRGRVVEKAQTMCDALADALGETCATPAARPADGGP